MQLLLFYNSFSVSASKLNQSQKTPRSTKHIYTRMLMETLFTRVADSSCQMSNHERMNQVWQRHRIKYKEILKNRNSNCDMGDIRQ